MNANTNLDNHHIERPVPRIEKLTVKNFRSLHNLELNKITPLTVFLGPNGSGKSTILDLFAFLSECFTDGLKRAWDKRNRFKEMRTRGAEGPIVIELKYREKYKPKTPLITYHLEINEENNKPIVEVEWVWWKRFSTGHPYKFLDFSRGEGNVIPGNEPDIDTQRINEALESPDFLAVSTLGQLQQHPRISALRRFITGWHLSYLTADQTRGTPESGPNERLSTSGDNLPNVIQYLKEQHPEQLEKILSVLSERIPRLEKVDAEMLADGRLLLQIKDIPFEKPILAKFASDGTMKLLAYLLMLYDPEPPYLIGIEEPENHLHPRILPALAHECGEASSRSQLLVTTHSPFFINDIRPDELWILHRDENGYTQAERAADVPRVRDFIDNGAKLGSLWMEEYFDPFKLS